MYGAKRRIFCGKNNKIISNRQINPKKTLYLHIEKSNEQDGETTPKPI